ncbi:4521_t:CDS:2 [Funneliformis caledonium]|uniref:4521_t:CDS:1 n=1 Tax=Funneliformis caledonium TaxID=1117310 RepID=A0A9N8V678_9GLOM|nr:4521_t:CDS:2 [Funneliformis caledonium]
MTDPTNILNIVNGLASETSKLDDGELACLFKYFTKDTTNLANVEKCLVACPNNNTKLLYLRELLKDASSETPRIWDEDPYKPLTLLIRKCYRDLASVVLDDNVRRIRITGNPGIGKTYFGYYLLYLLARQGRTILYESVAGRASYVFDGEETFLTFDKIITHSYKSRRDVWYIVDGMEPEEVKAKTILVCSPKKSHYANFDKYPLATIRLMPEWSLDEIHKCRDKMYPDTDIKKVDKLFSMWGGIPRFVLEKADDYVQQQKLINAVEICGEKIFDYIGGHEAGPEISHILIHLWTNPPTEEEDKNIDDDVNGQVEYVREIPYTQQMYYFASDYVGGLVTEKFKQNILEKLLRDIEIAHRMLRGGGNFKYRSLESKDGDLYQPFAKQEDVLIFSDIGNIENDKYYQPEIKNFPSIDAICAPNILLQMTTSILHPIKMVGLDKLRDKLAKEGDIHFYFVVPAQLYDRYQKQRFVTTKENNVRKLSPWIKQQVKQYVLSIDLSGTSVPSRPSGSSVPSARSSVQSGSSATAMSSMQSPTPKRGKGRGRGRPPKN